MEPSVVVENARVFLGDCREVLKGLPDNSVDSVVTDPPYELGFMGKKWDSSGIAYDVTVWEECLRVLKPGGHILAFGGTRTWHRLAVAIEDAGFEIRDNIAWMYGSGFPKSMDVSKAIDKMDAKGERLARSFHFTNWCRQYLTARQIDDITGTKMGNHLTTHPTQPFVPTEDMFAMLRPYLPDVPEDIERLVFERTVESKNFASREVIGQTKGVKSPGFAGDRYSVNGGDAVEVATTLPATREAQKWQGWGTALKPAFEPVVVGRKPIEGTVANNVLRWGVGGLNIDGSRIGSETRANQPASSLGNAHTLSGGKAQTDRTPNEVQGRWPANVILDEVTAGLLDEQSGVSKPKPGRTGRKGGNGGALGEFAGSSPDAIGVWPEDVGGGASRFFYVAKASKRDRNEGLEDLEQKAAGSLNMRTDGHSVRNGMNTGARSNHHPTVKPTALMRYLIKLVTPEGGVVLDPFTGSGSTGKAALLDGFEFVGAELTEDYLPIIEGRLKWAVENREDGALF